MTRVLRPVCCCLACRALQQIVLWSPGMHQLCKLTLKPWSLIFRLCLRGTPYNTLLEPCHFDYFGSLALLATLLVVSRGVRHLAKHHPGELMHCPSALPAACRTPSLTTTSLLLTTHCQRWPHCWSTIQTYWTQHRCVAVGETFGVFRLPTAADATLGACAAVHVRVC
jgi:hypothetical protein